MIKVRKNSYVREKVMIEFGVLWGTSATRDRGKPDYACGIALFEGMSLDCIKSLVGQKFLDLGERQNDGKTVLEFIDWMEGHSGFTANGYIVESEREDQRITLTGLEYVGEVSDELKGEFLKEFISANEVSVRERRLFCWYD